MIPLLYQLSYAGRTLILATPRVLSNANRTLVHGRLFPVTRHWSLTFRLRRDLNLGLI